MFKELFFRRVGAILGVLRAEYRQIYNRYFGKTTRFDGNATEIAEQVAEKLWNGDFYRTSLGHYDFFWMRDFGTTAAAYVKIGHRDRVLQTLKWAMHNYRRAGTVTLCIDRAGNTFNAPAKKSIDALPWLLHSLVVSGYELNKSEHEFLQTRLRHYSKKFIDRQNGMIKPVRYAELRDAVNYNKSAYSLAMIGRMSECAQILGLNAFLFPAETYRRVLLDYYWNGTFFRADSENNTFSSECALMPFFVGLIDDADMARATFDYIEKKKLNRPYPMQHGEHDELFHHRLGMGPKIMPNYTGSTVWTWMGTFYLQLLKKYKAPEYAKQYNRLAELIEKYGTYPELINHDGTWYTAPFYRSDPGMVWVGLFLALPKPKA